MKRTKVLVFLILLASVIFYGYTKKLELEKLTNMTPRVSADTDVLELTCDYTSEDLLQGVSAWDTEDGDLTDRIIVGQISRFIKKGESEVNYMVFDSANQSNSLTRRIRFTDYESPQISLKEPLIFGINEGSYQSALKQIEAADKLEGNLTEWIQVENYDITFSRIGSYEMSIKVVNSYGDTVSLALPVHVTEQSPADNPIHLKTNLVYADKGENLNPSDYIESISDGSGASTEELMQRVSWETADTSAAGCSEIHYTYKDLNGETAAETWLTVVVREQEDA